MSEEKQAAPTVQIGWLIERREDGIPSWYSLSEGRATGNPFGSWSSDPDTGLRFGRKVDGQDFVKAYLRNDAPFVNVIDRQWK